MKMNGFWVYTITTPDGMVYVGMSGKKYTYKRWKPSHYKETSLEPYVKMWGWNNLKKEVVKECPTRIEAQELEEETRKFCELNCVCINQRRSGAIIEKSGGKIEYLRKYRENKKQEKQLKELGYITLF